MSFKAYIENRRMTDTPAGDFTTDARRDKNFPDAATWDELKSYIQRRTSNPDVISAARQVWQGYLAYRKKL